VWEENASGFAHPLLMMILPISLNLLMAETHSEYGIRDFTILL
jgi:hypothetical protein